MHHARIKFNKRIDRAPLPGTHSTNSDCTNFDCTKVAGTMLNYTGPQSTNFDCTKVAGTMLHRLVLRPIKAPEL